ncbi:hypothetical protein THAOC_29481, partial [Thalassiosira oceanica]
DGYLRGRSSRIGRESQTGARLSVSPWTGVLSRAPQGGSSAARQIGLYWLTASSWDSWQCIFSRAAAGGVWPQVGADEEYRLQSSAEPAERADAAAEARRHYLRRAAGGMDGRHAACYDTYLCTTSSP